MNHGLLFAFGAAVVWGLAYVVDQRVLAHLSPLMFLFIASVCTVLILLPFVLAGRLDVRSVATYERATLTLIAISVGLTLLANYFILASIGRLGATTASIIEISYPLFVVLFSMLLLGSYPAWHVLIGGSLIFIGAAIIVRSL